jgi:hypothetical protein
MSGAVGYGIGNAVKCLCGAVGLVWTPRPST